MTEEDKLKVVRAQAEAWKRVGTAASCLEMSTDKDFGMKQLLFEINAEKKKISRLIDSLPD